MISLRLPGLNPKDDRLKMLRATQTDLEPILFLYDDVNMEVMKIIDSVDKENESDFVDENGTRHILKRFESPEITSFVPPPSGPQCEELQ